MPHATCGGATMISADLAAAVLRALQVAQAEQFVQQVVEPHDCIGGFNHSRAQGGYLRLQQCGYAA